MQRMALEGALKCVYWFAKTEVAHTTNYKSLLDFVKGMDCSYLEHLNQGGNAHYTSERILQEFLQSISATISETVFDDIKSSPAFSIMMDETTDVSVMKQLITYARYIKISGNQAEVKTLFVNIDDLVDGKAETIVKSTEKMFEDLDWSFQQCSAFGSDGAAVMVGSKSGVGQRLRRNNSHLINIHCIAHRLLQHNP
ncbi:zinc finger protein 862-like isoform X1 [Ptychodera flava]|uniref:zinc finger protein 862-like isoform X1 n=1 Tax=Ptychodera flava TaxID=63121 RepID=UPI003969E73A